MFLPHLAIGRKDQGTPLDEISRIAQQASPRLPVEGDIAFNFETCNQCVPVPLQ